ncbi:MAG: DUF3168 domain-containing protein [Pseudomonadota bacterium]
MTPIFSNELQSAIYDALTNDATITSLVGSAIYDATPSGTLPGTFILIGEDSVFDRSDKTHSAANYFIRISVVTTASGFGGAKTIAAGICNVIEEANLSLANGHLRRIEFRRAIAKRNNAGTERKIDLIFRAFIEQE